MPRRGGDIGGPGNVLPWLPISQDLPTLARAHPLSEAITTCGRTARAITLRPNALSWRCWPIASWSMRLAAEQ